MPRPLKNPATKLGRELDRVMLRLLREGVPLFNSQTGEPMLDADGKAVTRPPNGSEMSAVQARIKYLQGGKAPKAETPDAKSVMEMLKRSRDSAAGPPGLQESDAPHDPRSPADPPLRMTTG